MKKNDEKFYIEQDRSQDFRNTGNDLIPFNDDDEPIEYRTGNKKLSPVLRRVPLFVIVLSALGLIVILFAFFMEARANRAAGEPAITGPRSDSEIQAELDELNWVEQVFLPVNPFSRPGTKLDSVNGIVIHNIGNPSTTAMQNRNFFANLALTQERHASSNFIVCLDGTIIQCVPVDEMAYASNDRNADTLSIEVCHPDDTGEFTEESYNATIKLTAWLSLRYGLGSDDILRHHDIRATTDCPRFFVENEGAWEQFRADVQREIDRLSG